MLKNTWNKEMINLSSSKWIHMTSMPLGAQVKAISRLRNICNVVKGYKFIILFEKEALKLYRQAILIYFFNGKKHIFLSSNLMLRGNTHKNCFNLSSF